MTKHSKKLISLVLTFTIFLSMCCISNISVSANCTANSIISIAQSEVGITSGYHQRNKYTLWLGKISGYADNGYGYPWCATFTSWCAAQAGCLDIISKTASCNVQWANTQGTKHYTSSGYIPKSGDLIFYDYGTSNSANSLDHVGFVEYYDSATGIVHTIEGNYDNSVARVNRNYYSNDIYGFISPNYIPERKPTNPTISKSQVWYDLADTIEVHIHADGATSYYMSMFKDGQLIIGQNVDSGTFSIPANTYGIGNYNVYFSCSNGAGTVDSSWLDFSVVGDATYSNVYTSKPVYDIDDTVSITVEPVCSKGQVIGIDKNGTTRVLTEACDTTFTIPASTLGVGSYSAYFSVWNGSGGVDTKRVEFYVAERKNIGDEFCAKINNPSSNKYLTAVGNNVEGADSNCTKEQVWYFYRLSDNSYKIKNYYDWRAMDVHNHAEGGAGTNVQVYNDWDVTAQRFYIYEVYGAYYIKPVCTDMVLDLNQTTYNLEVWGAGTNWEPQKFNIEKINTEDIGKHSYSEKVVKPTFEEKGYTEHTCNMCGDSYKDNYTIFGDTNLDGTVSVDDVTYLQMHLARYTDSESNSLIDETNETALAVADIDGDGTLTINDATALQMHLAGYNI